MVAGVLYASPRTGGDSETGRVTQESQLEMLVVTILHQSDDRVISFPKVGSSEDHGVHGATQRRSLSTASAAPALY